jgi:phosphatidylinositol alpha 1,6-mannosyltransferase
VNDLRDAALRARLGEKARKVVLGRTWPAVCDELMGHYEAVTGREAKAA